MMNPFAYIGGCLFAVWVGAFFFQWLPTYWHRQWWAAPAGITALFLVIGFGTLCAFLWEKISERI